MGYNRKRKSGDLSLSLPAFVCVCVCARACFADSRHFASLAALELSLPEQAQEEISSADPRSRGVGCLNRPDPGV